MRHGNSDHFDLLPFINIMICVLGCMLIVTLSIAGLNLRTPGVNWLVGGMCCKADGTPTLVEWDGMRLTAHVGKGLFRFEPHQDDGKIDLASVAGFIRHLPVDRRRYVLLAVRPSGFGTLGDLQDAFRRFGIEIGSQPLEQEEQLNGLQLQNSK